MTSRGNRRRLIISLFHPGNQLINKLEERKDCYRNEKKSGGERRGCWGDAVQLHTNWKEWMAAQHVRKRKQAGWGSSIEGLPETWMARIFVWLGRFHSLPYRSLQWSTTYFALLPVRGMEREALTKLFSFPRPITFTSEERKHANLLKRLESCYTARST